MGFAKFSFGDAIQLGRKFQAELFLSFLQFGLVQDGGLGLWQIDGLPPLKDDLVLLAEVPVELALLGVRGDLALVEA